MSQYPYPASEHFPMTQCMIPINALTTPGPRWC
jgi:hypothetical protein